MGKKCPAPIAVTLPSLDTGQLGLNRLDNTFESARPPRCGFSEGVLLQAKKCCCLCVCVCVCARTQLAGLGALHAAFQGPSS